MKLLLASSELHPYSKSGGLADMVGALAKTLAAEGHEVGVVTPLYRGIREKFGNLQPFDWKLDLPIGADLVHGAVLILRPSANLTIYFIDQPTFYDRPWLYTDQGVDYPDNAERFTFLAKATANLARYLPWKPELVHVHDWQVGLVPLFIRDQKLRDGWVDAPHTCLTIHNLAYQGLFPPASYALTDLPPAYFNAEESRPSRLPVTNSSASRRHCKRRPPAHHETGAKAPTSPLAQSTARIRRDRPSVQRRHNILSSAWSVVARSSPAASRLTPPPRFTAAGRMRIDS